VRSTTIIPPCEGFHVSLVLPASYPPLSPLCGRLVVNGERENKTDVSRRQEVVGKGTNLLTHQRERLRVEVRRRVSRKGRGKFDKKCHRCSPMGSCDHSERVNIVEVGHGLSGIIFPTSSTLMRPHPSSTPKLPLTKSAPCFFLLICLAQQA